jgi:hypothetical protein
MKNNNHSKELMAALTHDGSPCVSMIIPIGNLPSDKPGDKKEIRHAIEKVEQKLREQNRSESELTARIRTLAQQAEQVTGAAGLGIFVSDKTAILTTFPFEVREKINVANSLLTRELVKKERYLADYFVLALNGRGCRFYKGKENRLTELNDQNFPASYDGIEYEIPVIPNQGDNSAQAIQSDKSFTTGNTSEYHRIIGQKLNSYIRNNEPLFIAGAEKQLAEFENATVNPHIKGKIFGNYEDYNRNQLADQAWHALKVQLRMEDRELLHRLSNMGREFISSGPVDVWYDVSQGKGHLLFVEDNLSLSLYASEDGSTVLTEPDEVHKMKIQDGIDEMIRRALKRNIQIVFVNDGLLRDHRGVVVINRY